MATQDAIRDLGVDGATAREIAGRADANLASIPYHFGTKDALIAEALIADARAVLDPVLELLASDRPPAERALAAAGALSEQFVRERARVPAVLAAIARAPHDEEVAHALATIWADVRTRLAGDVAGLVATGRTPTWVEPDAMAGLIVAVVSGVLVGSAVDRDGPSHVDIGGQFVALLLAVAGESS